MDLPLRPDTRPRPSSRVSAQLPPEKEGYHTRRRLLVLSPASHADFVFHLIPKNNVDHRFVTDDDEYDQNGVGLGQAGEPYYTGAYSHARANLNVQAARLVEWADVLCLALVDAGTVGGWIAGLTTNLTLTVLRGWDETKPIVMVPRMSQLEWKGSITRRHMSVLAEVCPWVDVMSPILTALKTPEGMIDLPWDGQRAFIGQLRYRLGLRGSGDYELPNGDDDADGRRHSYNSCKDGQTTVKQPPRIPRELILMIFEELNDWEIATAVGIEVNIAVPAEWEPYIPQSEDIPSNSWSLEYTFLKGSMKDIKAFLSNISPSVPLPAICARLIFKFSRTDILDYLVISRLDIYDNTHQLQRLPVYASSVYPNVRVLRWWGRCRAIPQKVYDTEPVDTASSRGFIDVLEWWRTSDLAFRFTERALESASGAGRLEVLEWWKNTAIDSTLPPIELQPGKSVTLAAQTGCAESLAWWDSSGIPYGHGDSVARIASNHGHVHVLGCWHQLKGNKMVFDNQVLVGATKNGHVDVLDWWKRSGLRVEFKTCDIEEALEDAVSGAEDRVRQWWAQHGLNLGVDMNEWLKVKVL